MNRPAIKLTLLASLLTSLACIVETLGNPTTAVEHSAQHPGEAPEVAEAPAVVAIPPVPAWTTQATVSRVIDGDTLEVEVRRVLRVRLLDCWAPESKRDPRLPEAERDAERERGRASAQNLRDLCEGKAVIVHIPMGDDIAKSITLGRFIGQVWLEGDSKSLSERQVEGCFADQRKPERMK